MGMSRILVVSANPNPQSLTHRLAASFIDACQKKGNEVDHWDLYQEKFDPILSNEELGGWLSGQVPDEVSVGRKRINAADELAFFYPTWWYDRPAILKGWFDRMLAYGYAFKGGEDGTIGLLPHKRAWVVQTSGADREAYRQRGCDLVIEKTIGEGTLRFCGVDQVEYVTFYGADKVDAEVKAGWGAELAERVSKASKG
jgi:NAD(P)H dehydrogenase (quinone)